MKLSEAKKLVRSSNEANLKAGEWQLKYAVSRDPQTRANFDYYVGRAEALLELKDTLLRRNT